MVRNGLAFGRFCRTNDRGVTGAAAQVSRQSRVVIGVVVQVRCGHAHHETRGAEPALATMVSDHCVLHRMQGAVGRAQTFNSCDVFAVQLRKKEDASVERMVTCVIGDHHSASTAIALVAPLFCTCEVALFGEPVEEGGCRVWLRQTDGGAVEHKRDLHGGDPAAVPWVQAI